MAHTDQGDEDGRYVTEGERTAAADDAADNHARPPQADSQSEASPAQAELVLHAVAQDLAEGFAQRAGKLLSMALHVRPAGVTRQTQAEFLAGVQEPTCCFALRASGGGGGDGVCAAEGPCGWLEIGRRFAFVCIERLLEGSVDQPFVPDRPLTAIERRLMRRLLGLAAEALSAAWPAKSKRRFEPAEGWGCEPLNVTARHRTALTARLELAMATHVGRMRVCLPAAVLAGLDAPAHAAVGPEAGPIELRVAVGDVFVPAEETAALAPGDIIATDTPVDGEAVVRVAGIPKFAGRFGSSGSRRAVTLTRRLEALDDTPAP